MLGFANQQEKIRGQAGIPGARALVAGEGRRAAGGGPVVAAGKGKKGGRAGGREGGRREWRGTAGVGRGLQLQVATGGGGAGAGVVAQPSPPARCVCVRWCLWNGSTQKYLFDPDTLTNQQTYLFWVMGSWAGLDPDRTG
jgi:hypothetical protein